MMRRPLTLKKTSRSYPFFALLVLLVLGSARFDGLAQKTAEGRSINVNEALDLNDLKIKNEIQQINSLLDAHVKFFKRAAELKQKSIISPRDPASFKDEADKRKAGLATLQSQFDSLINKLQQGNHWNETFDAQFLASLKNASDRSLLTQAGGARKLLQAGAAEFNGLKDDIDEEVRQISSRQTGHLRSPRDRVFAAHATPPAAKFGCNALLASYLIATATSSETIISCAIAVLYNERGCSPKIISAGACH